MMEYDVAIGLMTLGGVFLGIALESLRVGWKKTFRRKDTHGGVVVVTVFRYGYETSTYGGAYDGASIEWDNKKTAGVGHADVLREVLAKTPA